MKPIILLALPIILTSIALVQHAGSQAGPEKEQKVFSQVTRVGDDALRSFFMFAVSGHDYTIRADGRGERSLVNARSRNFNLKVDQRHIEQLYFLEHDADLLLIYQLSDKEIVRGYAARLNQTTLKPLWQIPVSGIDFDSALVEAGYLKLKAANSVVKVDLRSGALVENENK